MYQGDLIRGTASGGTIGSCTCQRSTVCMCVAGLPGSTMQSVRGMKVVLSTLMAACLALSLSAAPGAALKTCCLVMMYVHMCQRSALSAWIWCSVSELEAMQGM